MLWEGNTMITRIQMKECLPYDVDGAELNECQKVNFIYGANGSGKSTISEFMRNYGVENERYDKSSITWNSVETAPIMVYNREFRKLNFSQDNGIPGVFTLGEATIEDIRELERLKAELVNKREEANRRSASIKKKEEEKQTYISAFIEKVWVDVLKSNEETFQKAFDGFRKNKNKFYEELLRRYGEAVGTIQDREQLLARAKTLYAKKPEKSFIANCALNSFTQALSNICSNQIWATVITGNDDIEIGKLIKHLNNSSWVRQGKDYIEQTDCICPFCQKETIDDEFRKQLKLFFDDEFEQKINLIKRLSEEYRINAEQLLSELMPIVNNENLIDIGKMDVELFVARIKGLKAQLDSNQKEIQSKLEEPAKKIELVDLTDVIIELQNMVSVANNNICAHNKLVEEYDKEIKKLTDDVWATCISAISTSISTYYKEVRNIDKALEGMKQSYRILRENIEELSATIVEKGKNVTSVQPTVDEINKTLRAYGFTNFSVEPLAENSNKYMIVREDGTSASQTLSEGEETFITFLYFMQFTKGSIDREHVSDKKIIVLDDPISSLDSNILYIVGNMVKELSKQIRNNEGDVAQLFVFTHNVFFHKEASFIDGRTEELNSVNYWIIRKDNGISKIQSYGKNNPITTSYELLWKEIRNDEDVSLVLLQNAMRRIIENYFGMLGKRKDDYIVNQFDNLEEKTICRSLLAWINDGSHSIPDDLYIDSYTDAVPRYKEVFRQIFIKSNNEAHYNMMMGLIDVRETNSENA